MIRPGLEPGTFCVLDRCDNQLRHRTVFQGSTCNSLSSMGVQPDSTFRLSSVLKLLTRSGVRILYPASLPYPHYLDWLDIRLARNLVGVQRSTATGMNACDSGIS